MRLLSLLVAVLAVALPAQEPAAAAGAPVPLGAVVDATFTDLRWQTRTLAELGVGAATVVFFATRECPLVQRYLPRLGELAAQRAAAGVVVLVMDVGADERLVDAVAPVTLAAPAAVFGKDFDGRFARACGVDRTATAVVLDRERRLVYRGRVDDQYGYGGARPAPRQRELHDALEAVLAGRPVATAETPVSGCKITFAAPAAPVAAPTYAEHVAPIVHRHCAGCHRPGGEGPMSLREPQQVRKHAAMVAEVVAQGRMPLWYGDAAHGRFANHRSLSAAERATVVAWVAAGAPLGDPARLPEPPPLPTGAWRIGEPDQVIEVKAPVRLPADGTVPYKYFVLPFRFAHDTWVEAVEIRPSNDRVLHHCNLARVKWGEQFSQDGFITGYVPGGDPLVLDPGTAVRIPAGSVLALQAHYVTTGQPETDRLRVGLRFPRVPVQHEMQVAIAADFRFAIPPGARAHPVRAARKLPRDAVGIGMFVHMHLRGRDMVVTAEPPGGEPETLLVVPNYHFDWQQSYRWFAGERRFAAGTRIRALAHFDNSAWNPYNPDPAQEVRFGLETTDEMMYLFLFWVAADERLGLAIDPQTGAVVAAR